MNLKLVIALFVILSFLGCGDTSNNANTNAVSQEQGFSSHIDLDFGFSVLCPIYFTATNSPNWHSFYYDNANEIRIEIEDSTGKIKNKFSQNSYYFEFSQQDHKKVIEAGVNSGDYLRVSCVHNSNGDHTQTFSYRYHLTDKNIWKVSDSQNKVNGVFFVISMIADLEDKMVNEMIREGKSELDAKTVAGNEIKSDFPGAEYGLLLNAQFRVNAAAAQPLHSENSKNGRSYRRLKQLAETYSGVMVGDVQLLNRFLAKEFSLFQRNKYFSRPEISGAIFTSVLSDLSEASKNFSNLAWKERVNVPIENFAYKTNVLIDNSWYSELNWAQGKSNSEAYVTKLQVVKFDPQFPLNKLFFSYDISRAYGGCKPGIFSCALSSGVAGVYVCFNSVSDLTLGCVVFASVTDLIKVNTFVGKLFDPQALNHKENNKLITLSNSYNPDDSFGLERTISMLDLVNQINSPDLNLAINNKKLQTLTIGATVFIASLECLNCTASLNVKKLSVSKLQ